MELSLFKGLDEWVRDVTYAMCWVGCLRGEGGNGKDIVGYMLKWVWGGYTTSFQP